MPVESTNNPLNIYNPAAVVDTTGKQRPSGGAPSGGTGSNEQAPRNEAVDVNISAQVSAVSRARAAAGRSCASWLHRPAIHHGRALLSGACTR